MQNGFEFIYKVKFVWIIAIVLLIAFFGFGILSITNTLQKYGIHIVCISICILMTIIIGRKFVETIHYLDKEIENTATSENIELRTVYARYKKIVFCKRNIILCIVIPLIFFWSIFKQEYLSFDIIGFYGILVISITLFLSILGYEEYMWLLWLLYRISKCEKIHFNKSNPSHTPLLIYLAEITNFAKWCFLIEGLIYIFEYFILIPHEKLNADKFQMPDNLSFFITWIILFVVLIIAFPVIVLIQETLIAKIVNNLKQKQIEYFAEYFNLLSMNLSDSESIEQAYMYNSIMTNILGSDSYPIKSQRLVPALISFFSFTLHVLNLLSQIPELSQWISQLV